MQIYPPEWREWLLDFGCGLRIIWQDTRNKIRGDVIVVLKKLLLSLSAKRAILIGYALTVALACLWVPWNLSVSENTVALLFRECGHVPTGKHFVGYSFLWSSPRPWKIRKHIPAMVRCGDYAIARSTPSPMIDTGRVALEFVLLTALFGSAFLLAPQRRSP